MAVRDLLGEERCRPRVHVGPREIDEGELVLFRHESRNVGKRDGASLEQDLAQALPSGEALLRKRRIEFFVRYEAVADEKGAEWGPEVGDGSGRSEVALVVRVLCRRRVAIILAMLVEGVARTRPLAVVRD